MGLFSRKKKLSPVSINPPKIPANTPKNTLTTNGNYVDLFGDGVLESFTGSKFAGGFGKTKIYIDGTIDYTTLRIRSKQLYIENMYAAGLINRFVHNVINTGLKLQSSPENQILQLDPENLQAITDQIESRFSLFSDDPLLIDFQNKEDFDLLQWTIYLTAKLSGDCLVVLRTLAPTKLPQIEVIDGRKVQTPFGYVDQPNRKIRNGVEFDNKNRIVGYWVNNKRIPAFGEKSKRRIAWLVYGTKRLIDHTRGIPLLACALQALRELDRYMDSELRAAFVNSIFATWVKRTDTPGTGPVFGRAAATNATTEQSNLDGSTKESNLSWYLPGMMLDKLAPGEEPVSMDTKRPNLNFVEFTKMILSGIAWGAGLPPEIYFLQFNNTYSASRQASNEFNTFLRMERSLFAKSFNRPYYIEWLKSYALLGKIDLSGYVEALQKGDWEIYESWQRQQWIGYSRPSIDPLKEINAYAAAVENNFMSYSDAVLELRGDQFDKVLARKKSEQAKINSSLEDTETDSNDTPENVLNLGTGS